MTRPFNHSSHGWCPRHLLTAANARLDQSDAVAQTSGPALAGGLVSVLGAPWAVLVDAASYVISGLLLLRIPVVEPPRSPVSFAASVGRPWKACGGSTCMRPCGRSR